MAVLKPLFWLLLRRSMEERCCYYNTNSVIYCQFASACTVLSLHAASFMCRPRNDEDSVALKHLSLFGFFVVARRLNQTKYFFWKVSRSNLGTRIGAFYFVTDTNQG